MTKITTRLLFQMERWGQEYNAKEKWNLELLDQNGNKIDPALFY